MKSRKYVVPYIQKKLEKLCHISPCFSSCFILTFSFEHTYLVEEESKEAAESIVIDNSDREIRLVFADWRIRWKTSIYPFFRIHLRPTRRAVLFKILQLSDQIV